MPKFSPGDPVLIINGMDATDREYIGYATIVREPPLQGVPLVFNDGTGNKPVHAYCVDLTDVIYADFGVLLKYVYRDCDLMPLGPLDDEEEETREKVLIHTGNPSEVIQ